MVEPNQGQKKLAGRIFLVSNRSGQSPVIGLIILHGILVGKVFCPPVSARLSQLALQGFMFTTRWKVD